MIGVAAEITARKLTELHLESLALEDHLTRLPNRRALDAPWRDRLGHLARDELLVEAARRLRKGVRRSDGVARFGGDEFAVVAQGIRTRRQLEQLARRLIAVTAASVTLAAGPARIRLSIGIAVFPEDGLEPLTLLAQADAALYAAKRAGSGYRFAAEPAAA